MDELPVTTASKLAQALRQFNKVFMQSHRADLLQNFAGCKPGAIGVLFTIREGCKTTGERGMKVSEISKQMCVTSPTITQFLKELEANRLIERHVDQKDRRAVGIALTEEGEKLVSKVETIFTARFNDLVEYLGEEQSNQLAHLLAKAHRYFYERTVRNPMAQARGL